MLLLLEQVGKRRFSLGGKGTGDVSIQASGRNYGVDGEIRFKLRKGMSD